MHKAYNLWKKTHCDPLNQGAKLAGQFSRGSINKFFLLKGTSNNTMLIERYVLYAGPKLKGALEKIGCWTIEVVKRSDKVVRIQVPNRDSRLANCIYSSSETT